MVAGEEKPQTMGEYITGYWNWMKTGYTAPLKFIWTGVMITELTLLKPMLFFFTAFFGFLFREVYCMTVHPYYPGHWLWKFLGGNES